MELRQGWHHEDWEGGAEEQLQELSQDEDRPLLLVWVEQALLEGARALACDVECLVALNVVDVVAFFLRRGIAHVDQLDDCLDEEGV